MKLVKKESTKLKVHLLFSVLIILCILTSFSYLLLHIYDESIYEGEVLTLATLSAMLAYSKMLMQNKKGGF